MHSLSQQASDTSPGLQDQVPTYRKPKGSFRQLASRTCLLIKTDIYTIAGYGVFLTICLGSANQPVGARTTAVATGRQCPSREYQATAHQGRSKERKRQRAFGVQVFFCHGLPPSEVMFIKPLKSKMSNDRLTPWDGGARPLTGRPQDVLLVLWPENTGPDVYDATVRTD